MQFSNESHALSTLRQNLGKGSDAVLLDVLSKRALPSSLGIALDERNVFLLLGAARGAWANIASSPSAGASLDALFRIFKNVSQSPAAWNVAVESVATHIADLLAAVRNTGNFSLLAVAVKASVTLFSEGISAPLLATLLGFSRETLVLYIREPSRFFSVAKLLLVHINSIIAHAKPFDHDSTAVVVGFLINTTSTVVSANLHQSPDFKTFNYGITCILHSLLEKQQTNTKGFSPHKELFLTTILSADELVCGHPSLDVDPSSISPDNLVLSVLYLMSLTISVSEVAIEMLSPSQDQIQPFTCFLNLLDSIPSITLLIHFDSPSNTLYVHLVTSLAVFAQTIPSEFWVNGFERAIFESFVASETLLVKVLYLEVLLLLCEEVPHEIITHWLDVCESILASNPQNWILCSLTGTLARNLLEKETVKLRTAGLIEQQRDWLNMSNNLLLGASKWMWTQGGTGRTDATGHLYLDLSLGLWNTFLGMVDDEGASPQQTIGVLEGLSWPIRFLKASLGQVSTADATFEPVADAVVCLLEGMAGAFEVVEGFKNEGVDVIGMLCHLHRTVSELLEVVEAFERSLSLEQKSRVIQTLQEWIVSETNGSYLPQVQSIRVMEILNKK